MSIDLYESKVPQVEYMGKDPPSETIVKPFLCHENQWTMCYPAIAGATEKLKEEDLYCALML